MIDEEIVERLDLQASRCQWINWVHGGYTVCQSRAPRKRAFCRKHQASIEKMEGMWNSKWMIAKLGKSYRTTWDLDTSSQHGTT